MKRVFLFSPLLFLPQVALAHCPLCTVGAGALAVLAASLGVSSVVVGVMIGAFALALGMWLARLPRQQYFVGQYYVLSILIFLLTVIPIMPFIRDYDPLYISWWGSYGTLLHNTYTIDLFLAGVVIGALILLVAPYVSRFFTRLRQGRLLPYQGIMITFTLLILMSLVIQIALT